MDSSQHALWQFIVFCSDICNELLVLQISEAHTSGPGVPYFHKAKPKKTTLSAVLSAMVQNSGFPVLNLCPYQSSRSNTPYVDQNDTSEIPSILSPFDSSELQVIRIQTVLTP